MVKAEDSQDSQHTIIGSTPKQCVPKSHGMAKLADSGKMEMLRAKMNGGNASDKNDSYATVPINREDPQAGYDQQLSETVLNGKVSRNPKDGREKQD